MRHLDSPVIWTGSRRELEAHTERLIAGRQKLWDAGSVKPRRFANLFGSHQLVAMHLWALGRHEMSLSENHVASWYMRWWYRLRSMGEGETVTLPLIGAGRTASFEAHQERLTSGRWEGDLIRALFLGDSKTVEVLLSIIDYESTALGYATASLWRGVVEGDRGAVEMARQQETAELELGPYDDYADPWPRRNIINEANFAQAIQEKSQRKFASAIVEAHNSHVLRYSKNDLAGNPMSDQAAATLAMRASSMVALGRKTGLTYAPPSAYVIDPTPLTEQLTAVAPEYEPPPARRL